MSPVLHTAKTVWMRPSLEWHLQLSRCHPPSSLEDRVRELCGQAIAAKTEDEMRVILPQLQAATHDHIRYLRAVSVEAIPQAFGRQSNAAD
jgi:hypothetical protein